jgi:hypothetical protein
METRDEINSTADELERRAGAAIDDAEQRIADSVDASARRAQSFAERQKSLGAEQIDGVARAVHSAAREFEAEMPAVARSVHDAAARLDGAAESLRNRSAGEVLAGLERFAREQPAMFFGAAIVVGFAASRFLKSTADTTVGG